MEEYIQDTRLSESDEEYHFFLQNLLTCDFDEDDGGEDYHPEDLKDGDNSDHDDEDEDDDDDNDNEINVNEDDSDDDDDDDSDEKDDEHDEDEDESIDDDAYDGHARVHKKEIKDLVDDCWKTLLSESPIHNPYTYETNPSHHYYNTNPNLNDFSPRNDSKRMTSPYLYSGHNLEVDEDDIENDVLSVTSYDSDDYHHTMLGNHHSALHSQYGHTSINTSTPNDANNRMNTDIYMNHMDFMRGGDQYQPYSSHNMFNTSNNMYSESHNATTTNADTSKKKHSSSSSSSGGHNKDDLFITKIIQEMLSSDTKPSDICIDGYPLNAYRRIVARQLHMASQLLIQLFLCSPQKDSIHYQQCLSFYTRLQQAKLLSMKRQALVRSNVENIQYLKQNLHNVSGDMNKEKNGENMTSEIHDNSLNDNTNHNSQQSSSSSSNDTNIHMNTTTTVPTTTTTTTNDVIDTSNTHIYDDHVEYDDHDDGLLHTGTHSHLGGYGDYSIYDVGHSNAYSILKASTISPTTDMTSPKLSTYISTCTSPTTTSYMYEEDRHLISDSINCPLYPLESTDDTMSSSTERNNVFNKNTYDNSNKNTNTYENTDSISSSLSNIPMTSQISGKKRKGSNNMSSRDTRVQKLQKLNKSTNIVNKKTNDSTNNVEMTPNASSNSTTTTTNKNSTTTTSAVSSKLSHIIHDIKTKKLTRLSVLTQHQMTITDSSSTCHWRSTLDLPFLNNSKELLESIDFVLYTRNNNNNNMSQNMSHFSNSDIQNVSMTQNGYNSTLHNTYTTDINITHNNTIASNVSAANTCTSLNDTQSQHEYILSYMNQHLSSILQTVHIQQWKCLIPTSTYPLSKYHIDSYYQSKTSYNLKNNSTISGSGSHYSDHMAYMQPGGSILNTSHNPYMSLMPHNNGIAYPSYPSSSLYPFNTDPSSLSSSSLQLSNSMSSILYPGNVNPSLLLPVSSSSSNMADPLYMTYLSMFTNPINMNPYLTTNLPTTMDSTVTPTAISDNITFTQIMNGSMDYSSYLSYTSNNIPSIPSIMDRSISIGYPSTTIVDNNTILSIPTIMPTNDKVVNNTSHPITQIVYKEDVVISTPCTSLLDQVKSMNTSITTTQPLQTQIQTQTQSRKQTQTQLSSTTISNSTIVDSDNKNSNNTHNTNHNVDMSICTNDDVDIPINEDSISALLNLKYFTNIDSNICGNTQAESRKDKVGCNADMCVIPIHTTNTSSNTINIPRSEPNTCISNNNYSIGANVSNFDGNINPYGFLSTSPALLSLQSTDYTYPPVLPITNSVPTTLPSMDTNISSMYPYNNLLTANTPPTVVLSFEDTYFTPAEDQLLLRGILLYKENNWSHIAQTFLPYKSPYALMSHYQNMCAVTSSSRNIFKEQLKLEVYNKADENRCWTHLEDLELLKGYHCFGNKWTLISLFYLPHHRRKEIRGRWTYIQKQGWKKEEVPVYSNSTSHSHRTLQSTSTTIPGIGIGEGHDNSMESTPRPTSLFQTVSTSIQLARSNDDNMNVDNSNVLLTTSTNTTTPINTVVKYKKRYVNDTLPTTATSSTSTSSTTTTTTTTISQLSSTGNMIGSRYKSMVHKGQYYEFDTLTNRAKIFLHYILSTMTPVSTSIKPVSKHSAHKLILSDINITDTNLPTINKHGDINTDNIHAHVPSEPIVQLNGNTTTIDSLVSHGHEEDVLDDSSDDESDAPERLKSSSNRMNPSPILSTEVTLSVSNESSDNDFRMKNTLLDTHSTSQYTLSNDTSLFDLQTVSNTIPVNNNSNKSSHMNTTAVVTTTGLDHFTKFYQELTQNTDNKSTSTTTTTKKTYMTKSILKSSSNSGNDDPDNLNDSTTIDGLTSIKAIRKKKKSVTIAYDYKAIDLNPLYFHGLNGHTNGTLPQPVVTNHYSSSIPIIDIDNYSYSVHLPPNMNTSSSSYPAADNIPYSYVYPITSIASTTPNTTSHNTTTTTTNINTTSSDSYIAQSSTKPKSKSKPKPKLASKSSLTKSKNYKKMNELYSGDKRYLSVNDVNDISNAIENDINDTTSTNNNNDNHNHNHNEQNIESDNTKVIIKRGSYTKEIKNKNMIQSSEASETNIHVSDLVSSDYIYNNRYDSNNQNITHNSDKSCTINDNNNDNDNDNSDMLQNVPVVKTKRKYTKKKKLALDRLLSTSLNDDIIDNYDNIYDKDDNDNNNNNTNTDKKKISTKLKKISKSKQLNDVTTDSSTDNVINATMSTTTTTTNNNNSIINTTIINNIGTNIQDKNHATNIPKTKKIKKSKINTPDNIANKEMMIYDTMNIVDTNSIAAAAAGGGEGGVDNTLITEYTYTNDTLYDMSNLFPVHRNQMYGSDKTNLKETTHSNTQSHISQDMYTGENTIYDSHVLPNEQSHQLSSVMKEDSDENTQHQLYYMPPTTYENSLF